jgi:hypothetical protein
MESSGSKSKQIHNEEFYSPQAKYSMFIGHFSATAPSERRARALFAGPGEMRIQGKPAE